MMILPRRVARRDSLPSWVSFLLILVGLGSQQVQAQAPNACGAAPSDPPAQTWSFIGPSAIANGQTNGVRTTVTGRVNSVAANPYAPETDVWVATAGGGVWHLERTEQGGVPVNTWTPMTDDQESLASGALALDSCGPQRCDTVWVGGGENSIRRDTQYGAGVLRGRYNAATGDYDWVQLGAGLFRHGSISALVLDPSSPDNKSKTLYVGLTSGVTADATHATVTTKPAGEYGIYKSTNAGASWTLVLSLDGARAADLEIDPQEPNIVYASIERQGLWRSFDAGNSWDPMVDGIDSEFIENASWPELAVHRPSVAEPAVLYAVMVGSGGCPPPHSHSPPHGCSPALFRSNNGGDSWTKVLDKGMELYTYETYLHALAIHPTNPEVLWFGGYGLQRSDDGGASWSNIYNLHPDHHGLAVWLEPSSVTGAGVYVVGDGGIYVGDGASTWDDSLQEGLGVALFQSISATPFNETLIGGLQDNGTNYFSGLLVWDHINDGDAASTVMDSDDEFTFYDIYIGNRPRRCTAAPFGCGYSWGAINSGLGGPVAWYPPLIEDPTAISGPQHPLYFVNQLVRRSINDGDSWSSHSSVDMVQPFGPDVPPAPYFVDINSNNVITAIAPAPTDPAWVYVGMYDGRFWRTMNADSSSPAWTRLDGNVLPDRPVTSIAVHPTKRQEVYVAFGGLGDHSVYRTTNGGDTWVAWDQAIDASTVVAERPANRLTIEALSPHRVWLGTDSCVYSRTAGSGTGWAYAGQGMPNVAVYDFAIDTERGSIYAGTHGRGVWRRDIDGLPTGLVSELNLPICCFEGIVDPLDPVGPPIGELLQYMSFSAVALEPEAACLMSLEQADGTICSESEVDADGGLLRTDQHGALVADKEGFYVGKPMAWACYNGNCAGDVSARECAVAAVTVQCGESSVRTATLPPVVRANPMSALLHLEPAFAAGERGDGVIGLAPMLATAGLPSRVLCEVEVPFDDSITAGDLLDKLAAAIATDDGCLDAGVHAEVMRSDPGAGEDAGQAESLLRLHGARLEGSQLVPAITHAIGARVELRALGIPQTGQPVAPRLTLSAREGAAGGTLRVTEVTPLGRCTFEVTTERGDDGKAIAERLQERFLMPPELGRRGMESAPSCPNHRNPRDVARFEASLQFPLAHGLIVETTDPGLSYRVDSW